MQIDFEGKAKTGEVKIFNFGFEINFLTCLVYWVTEFQGYPSRTFSALGWKASRRPGMLPLCVERPGAFMLFSKTRACLVLWAGGN